MKQRKIDVYKRQIVVSLILSKTCRITDKIRNAVICGGFLFAFITVVSAALGGGSVSMALAVTAADVLSLIHI